MREMNPQLEGAKILSLTDSSGQVHEFISETEQEKSSFKLKYYMWLSRLFILFAIIALLGFMSMSLALFKLAPQVSVEPFLIINQDTSEGIVRAEAITNNMASKNQLMETFVAQYVILRNTIIDDEREMQARWYPGGMLNFLSAPRVKTYELSKYAVDKKTRARILTVKYWTASVTSFFMPGREFVGLRLINPIGFTVTRYSQAEVETL